MPLLEEIFDALGQAKVFNTLDLRFSYHQLPLREGDKVKNKFWGIGPPWEGLFVPMDVFSIWFEKCPYKYSKGHGSSFGRSWFAKCYSDDIIVFGLIAWDYMHHFKRCLKDLRNITLNFIRASANFFIFRWNI
jgi:hypothetical protein